MMHPPEMRRPAWALLVVLLLAPWGILNLEHLFLVSLCGGVGLLYGKHKQLGRQVLLWTCGAFVLVACIPIDDWILLPLEERFPAPQSMPERVDGIIVLSGAENREMTVWRNQPSLSDSAERLVAFVGLARRYPLARLVVSDGPSSSTGEKTLGATTAKKLFGELGLPLERVEFEEEAANTHQNGVNSQLLVAPEDAEVWVLVTSAFHMPRAVGVWRTLGWEVTPYPVDYRASPAMLSVGIDPVGSLGTVALGLREWGALLYYRLRGRTPSVFPGVRS